MVGADRLGVRFAPLFESTEEDRVYMGLVEDDPHVTYIEAIKYLKKLGLPIYLLQKLIGIMHQNFLTIFVKMSETLSVVVLFMQVDIRQKEGLEF